jgi:hypothetical protein
MAAAKSELPSYDEAQALKAGVFIDQLFEAVFLSRAGGAVLNFWVQKRRGSP